MTNWTKEQLEAITKDGENIIVSAGAGSGKTAVLSERVIHKLNNGIHINELLILTFTNNAAAEMKDRIKKEIIANKGLINELKLIESATITTFDAYVLSLVKKYHYALGIDANVNIIDSTIIKQKKKEIIDSLFNDYYYQKNEKFIDLVTRYGVKNDKAIKNKILSLDNTFDLKIDKKEFLETYIESYYSEKNINLLFNELENSILIRIKTIENLLYNLTCECDENFNKKIQVCLNPLISSKSYETIKLNLPNDFSSLRMPNGSSEKAKYYKQQIKKMVDEIKKMTCDSKDLLIQNIYKTKNDAEIIIDILKKLNDRIIFYKMEHNMFEFNDISKMAINLLKSNNDIRLSIKNSFKEIMIDEYQDTSDMQDAFIKQIENNNVYMVGDVKQSIYRFRNANPDIFKVKYNAYLNHNGGSKIDLNKNFRSRKEVLYSINDIFDHIMDDAIGNANYQKEHRLIFGNSSFDNDAPNDYNLEIYNYEANADKNHAKEEIEAFIIGNDIKNKINRHYQVLDKNGLRDATYKDFCILIDRTTSFALYNDIFTHLQIPLNVFKDEDILFTDETSLLNNILGLIIAIKEKNYKEYNFYYASIARSYLFEKTDKDIYESINNKTVFNSEIFEKCRDISLRIDCLSNYKIMELIINEFGFYNAMIKVGNVAKRSIIINNLLNKALEYNKIGNTIYDFKIYLASLIESKESIKLPAIIKDNDSVTITNIHKSKGLEYKICYFSGFHKEFNKMEIKDRILYNDYYGLVLPFYSEGFKNTFINDLYKEKYNKDEISEKIRLLYVALTRAKEKMIIVTSLDNNKIITVDNNGIIDYLDRISYKSFLDIMNSAYQFIEPYVVPVELPIINDNYKIKQKVEIKNFIDGKNEIEIIDKDYCFDVITEDHYSKTNNILLSVDEKENMILGTRLHYILENIDFKNPNYDLITDFEKSVVKSLLQNDVMKNISNAKIYKEYEFICTIDSSIKTGIIDLMVEYDNYIDIIDYKLKNTSDNAYLKQLNGYKDYIQEKTKKQVNIYLYSLLNKTLINLN